MLYVCERLTFARKIGTQIYMRVCLKDRHLYGVCAHASLTQTSYESIS